MRMCRTMRIRVRTRIPVTACADDAHVCVYAGVVVVHIVLLRMNLTMLMRLLTHTMMGENSDDIYDDADDDDADYTDEGRRAVCFLGPER